MANLTPLMLEAETPCDEMIQFEIRRQTPDLMFRGVVRLTRSAHPSCSRTLRAINDSRPEIAPYKTRALVIGVVPGACQLPSPR
jgi:hypothetical protein